MAIIVIAGTFYSTSHLAGVPWSHNLFPGTAIVSGTIKANLLDSAGAPTGISLSNNAGISGWGAGNPQSITTNASSWPSEVASSQWSKSNSSGGIDMTFGSVPNGSTYTLELIGYSGNSSLDTNFTVNGDTQLYNQGGSATVSTERIFTGTVSGGALTFTGMGTSSSAFVSGFRLTLETAPDTEKPVITLTGDAVVNVPLNGTYTELGATWTDNVDGSGAAIVGGDTVNTAVVGTYIVTYNYTDAAGNIADQVTRTVNVFDPSIVDQFTLNAYWAEQDIRRAGFHSSLIQPSRRRAEEVLINQALIDLGLPGMTPPSDGITADPGYVVTDTIRIFQAKMQTILPDSLGRIQTRITDLLTSRGWS